MNKTPISFDVEDFLAAVRHRSFAYIGAQLLIRAHLTVAPSNRLSRGALHATFIAKTPAFRALIEEVVDLSFREDAAGLIFHPAIDRAAAAAARALVPRPAVGAAT